MYIAQKTNKQKNMNLGVVIHYVMSYVVDSKNLHFAEMDKSQCHTDEKCSCFAPWLVKNAVRRISR